MGLLKKKVNELEDLLREKGRVEVERDENSLRYKKLVKHNDKLQRELLDCKKEITSLKAKLLEASELRVSEKEMFALMTLMKGCMYDAGNVSFVIFLWW